jgi:hypothetical protein
VAAQRSHCRYLREWVAVKTRWRLTVDHSERRTARRLAGGCRNLVLHLRRAPVDLRGARGGGSRPAYQQA